MIENPLQLTPLEVASGLVFGEDSHAEELPEVDPRLSPLAALQEALIPALERQPCLVSFSGGRDSSALLGAAVDVARREGLECPVPITLRFGAFRDTHESQWQEMVVRHLQLQDWQRQNFHYELDFLGPVATALMRRHGLLWPPNIHLLFPMLDAARGGCLLTGFDGDSVFRTWRWARAASILAGRIHPVPRDVLRVGLALAPGLLRRRRLEAEDPLELRWLVPKARKNVRRAFVAEAASEPLRWDKRGLWLTRRRYLAISRRSSGLVAEAAGAAIGFPFLDRRFLAALAQTGGVLGFGDMTVTMRAHFGSLLPEAVLARTDKADFGEALWGPYSRSFVAAWSERVVPIDFVDERGLRETWHESTPHAASSVLQALWLGANGRSSNDCRLSPAIVDGRTTPG